MQKVLRATSKDTQQRHLDEHCLYETVTMPGEHYHARGTFIGIDNTKSGRE